MNILDNIWCAFIKGVNALTEYLLQNVIDLVAWVISLLPSVPIGNEPLQWGEFGKAVGYFIPFGTMAQHFVMMLTLMALWYSVEYVMRWIKMIK